MTSSKSSDCSSKFLVEASRKDCTFSLNFTFPRREFDFTAKPEEFVIDSATMKAKLSDQVIFIAKVITDWILDYTAKVQDIFKIFYFTQCVITIFIFD